MKFSVDVIGLDGLVARMKALPEKMQRRVYRTAARRAMIPVRDEARRRAAVIDDAATRESIAMNIAVQISAARSRAVGGVVVRVGVRGGAERYANTRRNARAGRAGKRYATGGDRGNPGGDTWYWRFIELGTSRQAARPFLRPALETQAQRVTDDLAQELSRGLDKLLSEP